MSINTLSLEKVTDTPILEKIKMHIKDIAEKIHESVTNLITVQDLDHAWETVKGARRLAYIPLFLLVIQQAEAQTVTHKFEGALVSAFTDRIANDDMKLNGRSTGYTRDRHPDNSRIGMTAGLGITHATHREFDNARYDTNIYGAEVGAYTTVFNAGSTGDYYDYGFSMVAGGTVGAGRQSTTYETPLSGGEQSLQDWTLFNSIYLKGRVRGDNMTFEFGPYAKIFWNDQLDGNKSNSNPDVTFGLAFNIGFIQSN